MRKVPRLYYALLLVVVIIAIVLYGCQGVKQSSSNNPGDPAGPVNPGNPGPGGSPAPGSPGSPDQPGAINHIIVFLQENRSFDSYFGQLSSYWANHGYSAQAFDGLPLSASNPGCDPSSPSPGPCVVDG